jgi:hypothetical protein
MSEGWWFAWQVVVHLLAFAMVATVACVIYDIATNDRGYGDEDDEW